MRSEQLGNLITFTQKGWFDASWAGNWLVSADPLFRIWKRARERTVWEHVASIMSVLNLELQPVGPLVEEWKRSLEVSE